MSKRFYFTALNSSAVLLMGFGIHYSEANYILVSGCVLGALLPVQILSYLFSSQRWQQSKLSLEPVYQSLKAEPLSEDKSIRSLQQDRLKSLELTYEKRCKTQPRFWL